MTANAHKPAHGGHPPGDSRPCTYEQRLRSVLDVVRRYLPPDGIGAKEAMGEIVALVDPWPGDAHGVTPHQTPKENDRG